MEISEEMNKILTQEMIDEKNQELMMEYDNE